MNFIGKDYTQFRPRHDKDFLLQLLSSAGLRPGDIIADVGAGNGNSSIPLLELGYKVIAIEHNSSMRDELVKAVDGQPYQNNLIIISCKLEDVSADDVKKAMEKLGYSDRTHVDAALASSSLHYPDRTKALPILRKDLLKPDGKMIVVSRLMNPDVGNAAVDELHQLLVSIAPGYKNAGTVFSKTRWTTSEKQAERYLESGFATRVIDEPQHQFQNFEEFRGYLTTVNSLKQLPESGEGLEQLHAFFDKHAQNGVLSLPWKYVACIGLPQYRTLPDPFPPPHQRT